MNHKSFRFGQWHVDPTSNTLVSGDLSRQIEPRAMDVLLHLARHPHTVISSETLLDACWGDTPASDNAVHKIITQLRRALDDSAADPRYIETIRKRGYRLVAELSHDDEVSQGSWTHASPFRGLEAFEEQHSAVFFGRKTSVDRLVQVVISQVQADCAMVLVLGPSGAGKTSLVQAGLIPALKAGAAPADAGLAITDHIGLDCADMGQASLLETLASTLLDAEIDGRLLFANTSAAALADYMARDLPGLIAHLQVQLPTIRLALFIDRFEAVFRLPHVTEDERSNFIHVLEQLARSGSLLLLLACRNDFYPHLGAYPALMNVKLRGGHFDLAPPGSADIAQIVRHPAQAAQLRYTVDAGGEGLDELLCHGAKAGPDTLPLLQYCLQELYRQRTTDGALTHAAFHAMGGLEGAIGARAEQVISALGPAQIAALPRLLARLVLVAEDETTVTSRRVPWAAISDDDETRLVQALVDAHLFVSDLHGGAPSFGIAHEALLRRWPRVVAWVDEHRQALQTRSRISAQARRWQQSGRQRDMLLPSGTQANQAHDLLGSGTVALSADDRSFIEASVAGARRSERLRMLVLLALTTLAVLAGALGLGARSAQRAAEAHRTEAENLMAYMLGDFVEQLRPLGKLDLLDSISKRAQQYLADNPAHDDSSAAQIQRAKSLQLISEVRIARADPDGARMALVAGRAILQQQLHAAPADLGLLKTAGENAFWLGQIHLDRKEWPQARQYFEEYRDYADRQAGLAPASVDASMEQSYAYNNLGTVALFGGDPRRAAQEFARSVALKEQIYRSKPADSKLAADLANSLSWQARAQMQLGRLDDANALGTRERQLLQALYDAHPGETRWINRLSSAHSHHAQLLQAQGDSAGSLAAIRTAHALLNGIVLKDPSNRVWQRNLYIAELRVIDAAAGTVPTRQTLVQLDSLESRFAELSRLEPKKLNLQVMLANVRQRRAALHLQERRYEAAAAELAPALATLAQLYASNASDAVIRNGYIDALLLDAALPQPAGAPSRHGCERVVDILKPVVAGSGDFQVLAPWVQAHVCLNQAEQARSERKALEAMHYRDPAYLQYLSYHLKREKT